MHKPKAGRDTLPTIGLAGPRHLCVNASQVGDATRSWNRGRAERDLVMQMPEKVVTPFRLW